jgi:hypothetical protein
MWTFEGREDMAGLRVGVNCSERTKTRYKDEDEDGQRARRRRRRQSQFQGGQVREEKDT